MVDDMDDFNFYLQFCKSLIFNLPDVKDRMIVAQWLKKLRDLHKDDPESILPTEYLKLLLFAMHKDKLSGVFHNPPPDGPLKIFPGVCTALDMIDLVKPSDTELPSMPSIHMSFSGDLCEFVAVQEIPNFGLHGYYAMSTDPLPTWIQPRLGILKIDKYKSANNNQQWGLRPFPLKPKNDAEQKRMELPTDSKLCMERNNNRILESVAQPKMLQVQRMEATSIETRPCWGRNHYIDILLDQSSDFSAPQTNAFLHAFKDEAMKVTAGSDKKAHRLSTRRERTEMIDAPCTFMPDQQKAMKYGNFKENYEYQLDYPVTTESLADTDTLEISSTDLDWSHKFDTENITHQHTDSMMGTLYPDDVHFGDTMSVMHAPRTNLNEDIKLEVDNYMRRSRPAVCCVKQKQKSKLQQQLQDSKIGGSSFNKAKRLSKSLKKDSLNQTWKPLAHSSFLN